LLLIFLLSFTTIIGCGSTKQNRSTLDGTKTPSARPDSIASVAADSEATADQEAVSDTVGNEGDTASEDPEEFIGNAEKFCTEGNYAAADSNLKQAIRTIETIDAENDGEWFPSSGYVDEIVSLYNEKMPSQYPIPDEISFAAFQQQMVRSLDSMKIIPAESLSLATMGCRKNLTYDVPMVWNERVQRALFFYVNSRKNTIDRWFLRASYYIPVMRKMFADSDLPQDLAYLPLIESGFNPLAYSYANASGIWQFITSTGRLYGLRHNYWLDERRDPIKSTLAAISYLKKLYDDFGHWHLALAAYNCGENGVSRSISRCQTNDFWKLKHLPAQTRNYVPCFLAALTIAKNPGCFGVNMPPIDTFSLDTVRVNDCVAMDDIAQAVGVSSDSLKKMNPHILRWCTPPDVTNTVLYLPRGGKQKFGDFCAQLPETKKVRWCRYEVKENDNIGKIARRFRVPADGIKAINRLNKDRLAVGQSLFLPLSNDPAEKTVAYYIPPELPKDDDVYGFMTRYRIHNGDCISKIARKFRVTCAQLYRWNRLSASSKLRPGRFLIVRPAPPPEPMVSVAVNTGVKQGSTYIVQMGDTPFSIARRSGVAINDLLAWNTIDATRPIIHIGDTLKLAAAPTIDQTIQTLLKDATMSGGTSSSLWQDTGWTDDWSSAFQDNKNAPRDAHKGDSLHAPSSPDSVNQATVKPVPSNVVYYTVKDGDTLLRIATAFGVSIEQLSKDNDLKSDSVVVPGKVIKVVKTGDR
jgi:membrane-bound lytic murein transglycosylase D